MYTQLLDACAAKGIVLEIIDEHGRRFHQGSYPARFRFEILDRRFYRSLLLPNFCSLGEAYMRGYFTVNELADFLECTSTIIEDGIKVNLFLKLLFFTRFSFFILLKSIKL